jgi:hypothetical protein
MFYSPNLDQVSDTNQTAKCPRCSLPIIVLPKGTTAAPLNLPLGEVREYLQNIVDMVRAIDSTLAEAVEP